MCRWCCFFLLLLFLSVQVSGNPDGSAESQSATASPMSVNPILDQQMLQLHQNQQMSQQIMQTHMANQEEFEDSRGKRVQSAPAFLEKLYEILSSSDFDEFISWSKNGETILVKKVGSCCLNQVKSRSSGHCKHLFKNCTGDGIQQYCASQVLQAQQFSIVCAPAQHVFLS